ncbi:chlorohydrolase [Streptococcus pneumoniae]|nr:chlorohydrolase [Streptococcus pneumoniae]
MGKLLTRGFHILFVKRSLYSVKIKEQTRKLAAGCSKHSFEVVDKTDEVSSKHGFEVVDETDEVSSKHGFEVVDETDEVSNHTYGKVKLTWFEEIFEEY